MFATACAMTAAVCAAVAVADWAATAPRPAAERRWGRVAELLAGLGRRLNVPVPTTADLGARLQASGLAPRLSASDLMAVKAGAAAVALACALPLAPAAPGRLVVVLPVLLCAAGFMAPDIWIGRRTRARAAAIGADLPDVLDLLRVAIAAGLPLDAALAAVGTRRGGLLAAEMTAAAARIGLGMDRERSLGVLAARCPLPGVTAFVAAARRSALHGAPLAPALAAIAADSRAERARRRHEQAARAAPKIQLVVALLLVPAAMLLLAAGMVAGFA